MSLMTEGKKFGVRVLVPILSKNHDVIKKTSLSEKFLLMSVLFIK